MQKLIIVLISGIFLNPLSAFASPSDFLILQDFGGYKAIKQKKDPLTGKTQETQGYRIWQNPGIFAESTHFGVDHKDMTYETSYEKEGLIIEVEVTQHAGSESDKWLQHEMEDKFRSEKDLNLTYITKNPLRDIDGNWIWYSKGHYEWLSNYTAISIQVANQGDMEVEPLYLLKAYIKNFPSSISLTPDKIGRVQHTLKWLSKEMERRLWLCERWLDQWDKSKTWQKKVLYEAGKNLEIFLSYQQKYYNLAITEKEKSILQGYINQNNGAAIREKAKEYQSLLKVR